MLQPLSGRWKAQDQRIKDIRVLMNKLGDVLLDMERLHQDQDLQRDIKTALRAIEKIYARLEGHNAQAV